MDEGYSLVCALPTCSWLFWIDTEGTPTTTIRSFGAAGGGAARWGWAVGEG